MDSDKAIINNYREELKEILKTKDDTKQTTL